MSIRNYDVVSSIEELADLVDRVIDGGKPIAFDIETGFVGPDREKFSLHPETAIVVGFSFTDSTDWARYVPLAHDVGPNLDNELAAALLWEMLSTGRGVAHNAGFELRHLAKFFRQFLSNHLTEHTDHGAAVRASRGYYPIRSDTQVEAYLMAEYQRFGLKYLTKEMFGHTMTELFDLFPDLPKNRRKFLRFNTLELTPQVVEYACEDSVWCLAIHERYYPQVKDRLLYRVEKAIVQDVVPEMEDEGVLYDWAAMRRAAEKLRIFRDKYNADIMAELSELANEPIAVNLASPPQISDVLFNKLGYTTTVYTDKTRDLPPDERKMSTGKIALERLAQQYPAVQKIREWKQMTRLMGTYLEKYEGLYNYAEDGRAHPNHLSAFVVTGRFAVSDAPYQQCVPGSYQVLTPNGWERLDKLADGTPVAQYRDGGLPEGLIQFVTPSEVIRSAYHGDMIEFRSAEGGDWRYTPNHRIVYRQRRKSKINRPAMSEMREATAEQWEAALLRQTPGAQGRRLHARYMQKGGWKLQGVFLTEDEENSLRLAVAVQADGTRTNGYQYDIAVHKERKLAALRELGLEPELQSRGRWRVRVPIDSVSRWLDETKNFRADAILALKLDGLRFFVREVMQWDGDATRGCTYGQKNTRRQSVDVVQAAAALAGHGTSLYERPEYDAVSVNVHRYPIKGFGWQEPVRVPSDGMVYCVTVPTGMFLCRNDQGKVMVTGNSPKKYHYDLAEAKAAHERGDEPAPGTCFKFNFRDMIIAPPDHYILGFDLSQAELRAIAGEAQEKALLEAFENREDVHVRTASLMLGVPPEEVTSEQRGIGKTFNFALLYGMGVKSLADRLGIPIEDAQSLMDRYFAGFPGIAAYMAKQVRHGKQHGYVVSAFGRKLPIWEYQSDKRWIQQKGDRACVNYPIQGAATGDYMKIAMVRAVAAVKAAGLSDKIKLVMNIHDALEFYVHSSVEPQQVIALLQPAVIFGVPGWPAMKADWHIGRKWGSPTELDVREDGSIFAGGNKIYDPNPSVVEDEDGEEVYELPEIDPEVLIEVARTPARRIDLRLAEMPLSSAWQGFLELAQSKPGNNTIRLITPEGALDLPFTSGLRLDDLGSVSALLGDVGMSFAATAQDTAAIGASFTP